MTLDVFWLAKAIVFGGLGSWLLLAALNNLMDANTNITLLSRMMRMDAIREDGTLGQGLLVRAIKNDAYIPLLLRVVALTQLSIATTLILVALAMAAAGVQLVTVDYVWLTDMATLSVSAFLSLWFFFLIGGLWFGYWIKMGSVQIVHFTMLMFGFLLLLLLKTPI